MLLFQSKTIKAYCSGMPLENKLIEELEAPGQLTIGLGEEDETFSPDSENLDLVLHQELDYEYEWEV